MHHDRRCRCVWIEGIHLGLFVLDRCHGRFLCQSVVKMNSGCAKLLLVPASEYGRQKSLNRTERWRKMNNIQNCIAHSKITFNRIVCCFSITKTLTGFTLAIVPIIHHNIQILQHFRRPSAHHGEAQFHCNKRQDRFHIHLCDEPSEQPCSRCSTWRSRDLRIHSSAVIGEWNIAHG